MMEQPPHRAADDVFDPVGIEWTSVSPALARVRRTILLSVLTVIAVALVATAVATGWFWAWILPAVILVVGLHFFPLARLFGFRAYNLTAAALVVVAGAALLSGGAVNGVALALLATGAILWLTAVALLRSV